jgi:phage gp29-like protein
MSLLSRIKNAVAPIKIKEAPSTRLVKLQLQRIRQDAETRRKAIFEAEMSYFPFRVKMQQMYLNTKENAHIKACIERRKDLTILRKWEFKNASGEIDQKVTDMFCTTINGKTQLKTWFQSYLSYCLDAIFFGYTLINLNDIVDNEFPKIEVIKRWNVSPDRYELTSFPYMMYGINFVDDESYKDWLVYVSTPNDTGISPCGYGLFYELSPYEIFLRNLLGFNGDFIELFAQPFRIGKTNKTDESERAAFENSVRDVGSSGYAILDEFGESIEFLESSLGSSGYQGYDNFEKRLEDKVSQLILGHADAMKSIPGKLGNSGEESPAQQALEDKATKDAVFILPLVNKELFNRMRALGFNIPEGTVACMQNDNEEVENAHSVSDLAIKIKQAGLQMDGNYFTEKTGIPLAEIQAPTQPIGVAKNITNKLVEIYG